MVTMVSSRKIVRTYQKTADWNDSVCGSRHKVTIKQEGNKIRVRLDASKDAPIIEIIDNLKDGKWVDDNASTPPHSLNLTIKDLTSGETYVWRKQVYAGENNEFVWSAETPSQYEVNWGYQSAGVCKSLKYLDSERFSISNSDIQSDEKGDLTKEQIDRIGITFTAIACFSLLYTMYRFIK